MLFYSKFDKIIKQILDEGLLSNFLGPGIVAGSLLTSPNIQGKELKPTSKITQVDNTFYQELFQYIIKNEGIRLKPYRDTKGIWTIGIGHKIVAGENFNQGITFQQAYQLFKQDIQNKIHIARRLFPKFDSYPNYVKIALLDGIFRGDHRKDYKTTKLINNNNWLEASKEYLNNDDYRRSKKQGTGIWKRMLKNAKLMQHYGK